MVAAKTAAQLEQSAGRRRPPGASLLRLQSNAAALPKKGAAGGRRRNGRGGGGGGHRRRPRPAAKRRPSSRGAVAGRPPGGRRRADAPPTPPASAAAAARLAPGRAAAASGRVPRRRRARGRAGAATAAARDLLGAHTAGATRRWRLAQLDKVEFRRARALKAAPSRFWRRTDLVRGSARAVAAWEQGPVGVTIPTAPRWPATCRAPPRAADHPRRAPGHSWLMRNELVNVFFARPCRSVSRSRKTPRRTSGALEQCVRQRFANMGPSRSCIVASAGRALCHTWRGGGPAR
ncbi:Protein of unknown function [Gryllus bimaculatus]|nr:Protein of unknown function [Gryllus bimaculatus]